MFFLKFLGCFFASCRPPKGVCNPKIQKFLQKNFPEKPLWLVLPKKKLSSTIKYPFFFKKEGILRRLFEGSPGGFLT
jgi:hypothetical protein